MSKKVKCLNCDNCMRFSIPCKSYLEENPFLTNQIKKSLVCSHTMKTKNVNNEQYCKHFKEADEHTINFNSEERYNSNVDNVINS